MCSSPNFIAHLDFSLSDLEDLLQQIRIDFGRLSNAPMAYKIENRSV